MHEECYANPVFSDAVIASHPAPWLQLRAQRAAAPPALQSFDQTKVETLRNTPSFKPTMASALSSCRVVFATPGMVANHHKLLLGAAPGRPQIRFAFNFVDEVSRRSIAMGLDLAAMSGHCVLCGDHGQLQPYSHV